MCSPLLPIESPHSKHFVLLFYLEYFSRNVWYSKIVRSSEFRHEFLKMVILYFKFIRITLFGWIIIFSIFQLCWWDMSFQNFEKCMYDQMHTLSLLKSPASNASPPLLLHVYPIRFNFVYAQPLENSRWKWCIEIPL